MLALVSFNIQCHACVDHADLCEDRMRRKKKKKRDHQIVVGTLGYVREIVRDGTLGPKTIRMSVPERPEEMLWKGLGHAIEELIQYIPRHAQVVFFFVEQSKAFKKLQDMTIIFMRDPMIVIHGVEDPESEPRGFEAVPELSGTHVSEQHEMEVREDA